MKDKAIELVDVKKKFNGEGILKGLSFSLSAGSVHAFLGPNGAGKTTTMRIISGLLSKDEGNILYFNKEESQEELKRRQLISYLAETPSLYVEMTPLEFLSFMAKLKRIDSPITFDEWIEKLKLQNFLKRPIFQLSKGQRQRVAFASCLLSNAPLLILDEPTSGLDPETIFDLRTIIRDLKGKRTILLSTHVLHDADELCDEMTIIHQGRILFSGDKELAKNNLKAQKRFILKCLVFSEESKKKMEDQFKTKTIWDKKNNLFIVQFDLDINWNGHSDFLTFALSEGLRPLEFYSETLGLEETFFKTIRQGTT